MIHRVVSLTRNAWGNVHWFFGILVCLLLLVVLMPFVPVLRLYNVKHDAKRKYEDDAMANLDDLSGLNFLR